MRPELPCEVSNPFLLSIERSDLFPGQSVSSVAAGSPRRNAGCGAGGPLRMSWSTVDAAPTVRSAVVLPSSSFSAYLLHTPAGTAKNGPSSERRFHARIVRRQGEIDHDRMLIQQDTPRGRRVNGFGLWWSKGDGGLLAGAIHRAQHSAAVSRRSPRVMLRCLCC